MLGRMAGVGDARRAVWALACACALCAWGCSDDSGSGEQSQGVTMFRDVPAFSPAPQAPAPQPMAPAPMPSQMVMQPEPAPMQPEPAPTQPEPAPMQPEPVMPPPPIDTAGTGAMDGMDDGMGETGELESLRQLCVDTINDFRATLGLAPLVRASAEQESCSDDGAQSDSGPPARPHASAGSCPGLGAQNTCPNWTVGFRNPTVEDALVGCLTAMWNEGEPAQGVQACIADRAGCFQDHGHWINMSSATSTKVACGFYESSPGTWWMNQDFGR